MSLDRLGTVLRKFGHPMDSATYMIHIKMPSLTNVCVPKTHSQHNENTALPHVLKSPASLLVSFL